MKAYSLADITTIDGKFISHLAFTAVESNGFRSVTWPRTPEISSNMILLWQRAIKSCFLSQYSNSQKLLTQHQLGTWTKKVQWNYWRCPTLDRLYFLKNGRWSVFRKHQTSSYHYLQTDDQAEEIMYPILVIKNATNSYKVDKEVFEMQEIDPNEEDILPLYESSSEWESIEEGLTAAVNDPSILLDKFSITEEQCNNLAKGINEGTASVVSDGSFKKNSLIGPAGTSAVILSPTDTSNKNECATGANWITGTKEDQSAYRSELGGIIAALTIIDAIIRYKDISTGSVTISLDNDSAIDECSYDSVVSTNNKSFDYIQVIKTWIVDLPIKVIFRYV